VVDAGAGAGIGVVGCGAGLDPHATRNKQAARSLLITTCS
jgi:hypothetical protein